MIEKLLHAAPDYAWTFLRIFVGLIVFPYGMQKLWGWFGGPGIDGTLNDLAACGNSNYFQKKTLAPETRRSQRRYNAFLAGGWGFRSPSNRL
jgi:uncharacterized membrane protein YphA (DoxX/SURF4 family)